MPKDTKDMTEKEFAVYIGNRLGDTIAECWNESLSDKDKERTAAVAEEREACAKIADEMEGMFTTLGRIADAAVAQRIARIIRERSKK